MVKKQNRLFLRKHTYYVRIAVPRDLFFIVKRNEVRYSLNTKNYYDACQKVRIISVMLDILFNKVRNKLMKIESALQGQATDVHLSREDYEKFFIYELNKIKQTIDNNFEEIKQGKFSWDDVNWLNDAAKRKFEEETSIPIETEEDEILFGQETIENCFENYLKETIQKEGCPASDKLKQIYEHKPLYKMNDDELLERHPHLDCLMSGLSLIEDYAKNYIQSFINDMEYRTTNPFVSKWLRIIQEQEMKELSKPSIVVEWKDVIEKYNRGRKADYAVKDATIKRNQQKLEICFQLIGKTNLAEFTASDCSELSSKLEEKPKNNKGTEKLSIRTRTNYLIVFKNFMEWCYREGYVSNDYSSNIVIPTKKVIQKIGVVEKVPFDKKDLLKFFNPDVFLKKIRDRKKIWRFYIPLIAMTTGARINEICQLGINDIKKEKNIWYYDLNDEEETKSLKTIKSKRKVPIHSIVLEQGFLEFVKYMKSQKSERLFSDLTYREDSNYSQKPKNFYSEYIRDIGITDPKKTFHSFRHLFKQMMEKSKIRTEVQNAICGWEGHNIGENVYGKIDVKDMKDAIEMVKFNFLQKTLQQIKDNKPNFLKFD